MTEQEFQTQVLSQFGLIHTRLDSIDSRLDTLSDDFRTFQTNQEQFNTAIWNLNNQAFQAINEIRAEVLPPWKQRKTA